MNSNETEFLPHLTVAAIIEDDGRYLLVEERDKGQLVYNQPAGHVEDGESFIQATVREVLEETGRQFTAEALIGCYRWRREDNGETFVRIALAGTVSDRDAAVSLDADIVATHWVSYDDIASRLTLRSPLVLKCLDDYREGHRHPLSILRELD